MKLKQLSKVTTLRRRYAKQTLCIRAWAVVTSRTKLRNVVQHTANEKKTGWLAFFFVYLAVSCCASWNVRWKLLDTTPALSGKANTPRSYFNFILILILKQI